MGDALWNAFLVEVSRDLSVSKLGKIIWEEKKNFFNENKIDENNLKLWKVDISMEGKSLSTAIHAKDEEIKEQLIDENQLNPFQDVGDYFVDSESFSVKKPTNSVIRIIIQPDYGKCLYVVN